MTRFEKWEKFWLDPNLFPYKYPNISQN